MIEFKYFPQIGSMCVVSPLIVMVLTGTYKKCCHMKSVVQGKVWMTESKRIMFNAAFKVCDKIKRNYNGYYTHPV